MTDRTSNQRVSSTLRSVIENGYAWPSAGIIGAAANLLDDVSLLLGRLAECFADDEQEFADIKLMRDRLDDVDSRERHVATDESARRHAVESDCLRRFAEWAAGAACDDEYAPRMVKHIAAIAKDALAGNSDIAGYPTGISSRVETSARQPPKSIATVINNNQPGWTNIVETAPNVTLPVGTKLYDESALISVGCGVADEIWKRQSSVEPSPVKAIADQDPNERCGNCDVKRSLHDAGGVGSCRNWRAEKAPARHQWTPRTSGGFDCYGCGSFAINERACREIESDSDCRALNGE